MANGKAIARRREARRGFRHTEEQWVVVVRLIAERWGPEQISGILKLHGPFTISHETIYKHIINNKKEGRCIRICELGPRLEGSVTIQGIHAGFCLESGISQPVLV